MMHPATSMAMGNSTFIYGGYYRINIGLAFGNGDGTFSYGATLPTDGYGGGFAVGDLNGDGKPDFVFANNSISTINVFLGGQFSGLTISSAHSGRFTAGATGLLSDHDRQSELFVHIADGHRDRYAADGTHGDELFPAAAGPARSPLSHAPARMLSQRAIAMPPITISVNVSAGLSPSTINNHASVTYAGVTNNAVDPTAIVLPSTTSLSESTSQAPLGTTVTFTATVTGGISGSVIFVDGGNVLGSAVLSGTKATLSTRLLPAGVHSVRATYSGDSTHAPSGSGALSLTVSAGLASGLSTATAYATGAGPRSRGHRRFQWRRQDRSGHGELDREHHQRPARKRGRNVPRQSGL